MDLKEFKRLLKTGVVDTKQDYFNDSEETGREVWVNMPCGHYIGCDVWVYRNETYEAGDHHSPSWNEEEIELQDIEHITFFDYNQEEIVVTPEIKEELKKYLCDYFNI